MPATTEMTSTARSRPIEIFRGSWGAALLVAPRFVLQEVHHVEIDPRSLVVTRILGARQLAQALLSGIRPSPEVLAMGAWVDAAHAVSAAALAVLDPPRARAATTDVVVASIWAVAGYRDLSDTPAAPSEHDRRRNRLARIVLAVVPGGAVLTRRMPTVLGLGHAGRSRGAAG